MNSGIFFLALNVISRPNYVLLCTSLCTNYVPRVWFQEIAEIDIVDVVDSITISFFHNCIDSCIFLEMQEHDIVDYDIQVTMYSHIVVDLACTLKK